MDIINPTYSNNYSIEDIEDIFKESDKYSINLTQNDMIILEKAFNNSHYYEMLNQKDYDKFTRNEKISNKYRKTYLIEAYRKLIKLKKIERNYSLEKFMRLKVTRGNSGVVVITTFMSGTQFGDEQNIKRGGCPENCHYCPFERDSNGVPTQPRSYLSTEPGNMRATQNKHHPLGQVFDRAHQLEMMGHISPFPDVHSKIEIIISGGTFNFFPHDYIVWYVTCTYYALNVYHDYKITNILRPMKTLEEEQQINESASLRMIGLTIETRPDRLFHTNFETVRFFRRLGVTRVQIGVQHTCDKILKYINRNCTNEQNKEGIAILKQNGFKTDIHLMLDLPMPKLDNINFNDFMNEHLLVIERVEKNLNMEIPYEFKINALRDMKMIYEVISDPDYQADQWKVYPTEVTPYTKILEWYESGKYSPYAEFANGKLLEAVIVYLKTLIHDYIRINRVIRDIPPESIEGGIICPDMRNNVMIEMAKLGKVCRCIRCREVGSKTFDPNDIKLHINTYESSGGIEYFISYENSEKTILYGMIRLRLNYSNKYTMDELIGCALIRELHVYGIHSGVGDNSNEKTQHKGLGKKLLQKAEEIAYSNGFERIVVISGVGVKEYYRKHGYEDYYTYMIKNVNPPLKYVFLQFIFTIICLYVFIRFSRFI
jgi:histone acetyltransferase (RNA polymerase elongator complex component)